MKVEVKIDNNYREPTVIIYTSEITSEISELVKGLGENISEKIIGTLEDKKYILKKDDIESFFSENNKVYARIGKKFYKVNYKLYELEKLFQGTSFVRISNSEIVNFNKVDSLNLKDSTIYLYFKEGGNTYVSRRFIKTIKQYLKI